MELQKDTNEKISSEISLKQKETMETVFEREKEKWRLKMGKVFGDQHPYDFCVVYGHVGQGNTEEDIAEREAMKAQPFERLHEMNVVDKEMEAEFNKFLSNMEGKVVTPSLKDLLMQRKEECDIVFKQFEEIIAQCERYFSLEYKDCLNREERQTDMQKSMLNIVEKYLTEVEEAGEREIIRLKDNISCYMREMGMLWSDKIEDLYKDIENQPFPMQVLGECADDLTSKDVRETFIEDQQDTSRVWKKAFDDLLMLSSELKRYRCTYSLTKTKLERATYWMNRNYRDNMPKLTQTQRQIAMLVDRNSALLKDLVTAKKDVAKERREQEDIKLKYYSKIAALRYSNKLAYDRTISTHENIYEVKKEEVSDLLNTLLNGDEMIHREILDMPWDTKDLSFLEPVTNNQSSTSNSQVRFARDVAPQTIKTLHEDDFAHAYRELVCSGQFELLLNYIAEELGFVLDFRWVDYAKKTLELKNEIRWLELFKVFKIDFTDDLKNLKDHMMKFARINEEKEATFDVSQALDGFLSFARLKRQSDEASDLDLDKLQPPIHREFWKMVDKSIPKSLLWDSVLEILKKYRVLLQSRQNLVARRSELVKENEELDKYMENYNSFKPRDVANSSSGDM